MAERAFDHGLDESHAGVPSRGLDALAEVLLRHPAIKEKGNLTVGLAAFGPGEASPQHFAARREVAELLFVGTLALGLSTKNPERFAPGLMRIALGGDRFSTSLRGLLQVKPYPLDPPRLPELLTKYGIDERRMCMSGLVKAMQEFGRALEETRPRSWATGITGLSPAAACGGGVRVVVQGSGFGASRPADVYVYFPTRSGGCVAAKIIAWSDTAITVETPPDVGEGCVGFVRFKLSTRLPSAASQLAGELERCLGMAGSSVAHKLRQGFGGPGPGPVPCPPCLPGGANRLRGGLPTISSFGANGQGHDIVVEPGTSVVVGWSVSNATSVVLTRTSSGGPFLPPTGPLPMAGSHSVGPFAERTPTTATYRLTATNGCGSVARTLTVRLRKTPSLSIGRIEVVQTIQRANNSVRLVARKRTAVRVYVNSGMSGGFDSGEGPDVQPDVSGRVVAFPAGAGQGFDAGPPWTPTVNALPAGTHVRADGTHSLNFELPVARLTGSVRLDVRVAVQGHEADVGGPWTAFATTTVDFLTQPSQEVLPVLIADVWTSPTPPTPTRPQYDTSLQGARSRFPIAEDGFVVNPELNWSNWWPGRDFRTDLGWMLALADLAVVAFLFPTTPVGGIRTGVVPNHPDYAMNGMATPRVGPSIPAQISRQGVADTFAHEMGHAFGLGHADCGSPVGLDPGLPARTDDVGMHVATRTVIPAGRGELMSYCDRPDRWPSIAFTDLIFGRIPI